MAGDCGDQEVDPGEMSARSETWYHVPEVLLHSARAASRPAALLLPQIRPVTPSILGRRALPAGRIAALDVNKTSGTRYQIPCKAFPRRAPTPPRE